MLTAKPRVALFVTCQVDLHRPTVGFIERNLARALATPNQMMDSRLKCNTCESPSEKS